MKRKLQILSVLMLFLVSCTKDREPLTESVSVKSVAVPTSLTAVLVEGTSQITVTMSKSFRTQATPLMLSPAFELLDGYTISPASGTPVSFGTPSLAAGTPGAIAPVTYTLTSPSGVKRLYSARVLFSLTL